MPPATQSKDKYCSNVCFLLSLREKVTRVLQAQADELLEVKEASEGSIAVAVGLKHVRFFVSCKCVFSV